MWRKIAVLIVILALAVSLGAGCKRTPEPKAGVLRYNIGTDPETLDSAQATGSTELTVLNALFEGLTRMDKDSRPQPANAESWEASPDGLVYTFHLRDGLRWSNGDPLTAEDYRYSWLRALAPGTSGDYAYQLWYIKGAQEFSGGTGTAEEVGIEVLDPTTLRVTLVQPAPYFVALLGFATYFPVHKVTAEAAGTSYGSSAKQFVSNGPFKLRKWKHRNVVEMQVNENYWDRQAVKLDRIIGYTIEEESTELAMFRTGEIDITEDPPVEEMANLKSEGLLIGNELSTYYYIFNCTKKPFDDARVRKAFSLAINRQEIVDKVTQGGQQPALAIVPPGIPNPVTGRDFREEGGQYFKDSDLETARALLAEAGYPGGQGLPPIEILINNLEMHTMIAQAIMEMWKSGLGVTDVSVRSEEWGVYLNTRDAGDFQVSRAGWGADYPDPMTFLDLWMTGGGNNNTFWGTPEYDKLILDTRSTADETTRYQNMHQAERIVMEAMPVAPIYFYTHPHVIRPWVEGLIQPPFGPDYEFKWVSIKIAE